MGLKPKPQRGAELLQVRRQELARCSESGGRGIRHLRPGTAAARLEPDAAILDLAAEPAAGFASARDGERRQIRAAAAEEA
jgi:hypothetical protein